MKGLNIHADIGEILNISGSIDDDVPAFDCNYRITAGDAIVSYSHIGEGIYHAAIIQQSKVANVVIELVDSWFDEEPGKMIPVVKFPFDVDAIQFESLTLLNNIDDVYYLSRGITILSENQLKGMQCLSSLFTTRGKSVEQETDLDTRVGWSYFNLVK